MEKKSTEKVQNDNFEILLNEIVQRQVEHTKTMTDLVQAVNTLTSKQNQKEEKPEAEDVAPTIDINPLKEILQKGITDLKIILSVHPKSITKKFQILLFPEQDAKLFYKIVFGRWFLMILIALFLHLSYKWFIRQQEIKKQIEMEKVKYDPVLNAWNYLYLYSQKNKKLRTIMDSALLKSQNLPGQIIYRRNNSSYN